MFNFKNTHHISVMSYSVIDANIYANMCPLLNYYSSDFFYLFFFIMNMK